MCVRDKHKCTEKQGGGGNGWKFKPELPEPSFMLERNKSQHKDCKHLRSFGREKHNRKFIRALGDMHVKEKEEPAKYKNIKYSSLKEQENKKN